MLVPADKLFHVIVVVVLSCNVTIDVKFKMQIRGFSLKLLHFLHISI